MKKIHISITERLEEYTYGAVALRNVIKQHRAECRYSWTLRKELGVRILYVYIWIGIATLRICSLIMRRTGDD